MVPFECWLLDRDGALAGPPQPLEGGRIERAYERAFELLMAAPERIGFELHREGRPIDRFVIRAGGRD